MNVHQPRGNQVKATILLASLLLSGIANAETTVVLNPGPGTQYLAAWCGGQSINEYAIGWLSDSTARTQVVVSARCSSGGRGAKVRTISTCWTVDFDRNGAITNRVQECADEVLPDTDVDGALLYNVSVIYISGSTRSGVRAAITIPDAVVESVDVPVDCQ